MTTTPKFMDAVSEALVRPPARYSISTFEVGDLIQHHRRYWPAQTITAITPQYGSLRIDLSGGSYFAVSAGELTTPAFIRPEQS
jgi:hypothetical protein